MKDKEKTKEQLIEELAALRKQVVELKKVEIKCKQTEKALRVSSQQWQTTFETISDAVSLIDNEGRILQCNKAMMNFLKKPREEIIGHTCWELKRGSSASTKGCLFKQVRETQRRESRVASIGNQWFSVAIDPILDKKSTLVGAIQIITDITEIKQNEEKLKQSLKKLCQTLEGTINALAITLEKRDPYTSSHQKRVTQLACAIAKEMEFPEEQIEAIRIAGLLHDVGKIYVPAEILSKPARLSDAEFNIIKTHPLSSYEILQTIAFPWPVAQIVLQHHERLNGSGYPSGLKDTEIILSAKILCVADVVEAMSSHRPYRPALGVKKALKEISKKSGINYEPKVVDACLRLFTKKRFKFK